jgi:hypothetical protein
VHHCETAWKEADALRAAVRDAQRRLQLATEDARVSKAKAQAAEAQLADARSRLAAQS